LVNEIVGAKVAIVSDRPQTTRRAIRGIATDRPAGWQMVLVDLPGVQRPRDSLTERMQRRVERELADADAVLLVVDGHQGIGPGDRFIANVLLRAKEGTPVVCAVNKCDRLRKAETAAALAAAAELEAVDEVFPVSATTGAGLKELIAGLTTLLPEGPFLYPPEERSDLPSDIHLAELIREQVLRRTREEIPHAVEVVVEEIEPRQGAKSDHGSEAQGAEGDRSSGGAQGAEGDRSSGGAQGAEGDRSSGGAGRGLVEVRAQVWVETQSQKGILVGKGGRMVREVGTAARKELERDLGTQVFLELRVNVREHWRRDDALLDRIGIE
jgi:GTP-binding protein Era